MSLLPVATRASTLDMNRVGLLAEQLVTVACGPAPPEGGPGAPQATSGGSSRTVTTFRATRSSISSGV